MFLKPISPSPNRKILSKSGWYSSEGGGKSNWRTSLPTEWRGSKPMQRKIPDLDFSTVMQVPSTADGRLLKGLARIEPRLAKISGYQCKLIQKGGCLSRECFPKIFQAGNVQGMIVMFVATQISKITLCARSVT